MKEEEILLMMTSIRYNEKTVLLSPIVSIVLDGCDSVISERL